MYFAVKLALCFLSPAAARRVRHAEHKTSVHSTGKLCDVSESPRRALHEGQWLVASPFNLDFQGTDSHDLHVNGMTLDNVRMKELFVRGYVASFQNQLDKIAGVKPQVARRVRAELKDAMIGNGYAATLGVTFLRAKIGAELQGEAEGKYRANHMYDDDWRTTGFEARAIPLSVADAKEMRRYLDKSEWALENWVHAALCELEQREDVHQDGTDGVAEDSYNALFKMGRLKQEIERDPVMLISGYNATIAPALQNAFGTPWP